MSKCLVESREFRLCSHECIVVLVTLLPYTQVLRFGTPMYDPETGVGKNLGTHYNTTPGSKDFNAGGTAAHPFRTVNGRHSVLIDAGLVGARAREVENYLYSSGFVNQQVQSLEVQVRTAPP